MKNAKWEMITGYEDRYMVSNKGQVWSCSHNILMKQSDDKDGYKRVTLRCEEGDNKTLRVHRLVAQEFCDKPRGMDIVNHLNMIKDDNRASNLEWTNSSGNSKHAYENCEDYRKAIDKNLKRAVKATTHVIEIYKDDSFVAVVEGQLKAAELIDIDRKTIYNCIRENRATRDGYTFKKVGDALAYATQSNI